MNNASNSLPSSRRMLWHLIGAFTFFSIGLVFLGYYYFQNSKEHLERESQSQLSAIADLKVQQIFNWRQERVAEVSVLAGNPLILHHLGEFLQRPGPGKVGEEILYWMHLRRKSYKYARFSLVDLRGKVLLSVPDDREVIGPDARRLLAEAVSTRQVVFSDIYKSKVVDEIRLGLFVPIFEKGMPPIGAFLIRLDVKDFLFPLVQSWPTPSPSAETILVHREGDEVVFLNELRHQKGTALNLRFPVSEARLPAALAVRGEEGVAKGVDYRGKPVLAAWRKIPESPWFLVAKVDQEEVDAPLKERAWGIGILVAGMMLAFLFALVFFWSRQNVRFRQRQLEEQIERETAEKRFDFLSKYANDIIMMLDEETKIMEVNDRAVEVYGYSRDELLRLPAQDLRPPEKRLFFDREFKETIMEEGGIVETLHQRKDGIVFPVEISSRLIEVGGRRYYQNIIRDISERKRGEEELRLSRQWLSLHVDQTPLAVVEFSLDGRMRGWNPGAERVFGYKKEEALGQHRHFIVPPEVRGSLDGVWEDLVTQRGGSRSANRNITKDGRIIDCEWFNTALKDEQGKTIGVASLVMDVTDRKRAEEDLRKSEEESKRLAQENALVAEMGRIIGSTPSIEDVFELFSKAVAKLIPFERIQINLGNLPEDDSYVRYAAGIDVPRRRVGERVPLTGTATLECFRTKSSLLLQPKDAKEVEELGARFPRLLPNLEAGVRSAILVPLIAGDRTIGVLSLRTTKREAYAERDVRLAESIASQIAGAVANAQMYERQKRMEGELKNREERYRRLVENAPLGILTMDAGGKIIDANRRLIAILGSPSVEATKAFNMLSSPPLVESGISGNFRRCLETGESGEYETPYRTKWGVEVQMRYHLTAIRGEREEISGVQALVEDISERKKLQEQLQQAQKMEAIGTLAGGIAHDFNNILAAILGYAELAALKVPENSGAGKNLEECLRAVHRAKELVRQILSFSRQGKQERKPVDARPIVKEGLKFLRASLPATIEIRERIEGNFGLIEADPTEIHQVLMNLCTNAAHAMREKGGVLEVSLERFQLAPDYTPPNPEMRPGPHLKLRVSDTGEGIPPGIQSRIFEPYFTTKEVGKGTGLGLAVVHGIVNGSRGGITVSSEPGKGSTFEVLLPELKASKPSPKGERSEPLPLGGRERILFVDDENAIVEIAKSMLEGLGYEVEARTSSIEARKMFQANPDRFDLVITDMTMPNMTGDRLAREILGIRPGIPIILCTGFSEHITEEEAKALGIREFVMKPLVMKDLARIIRRVLGGDKKGRK